MKKSAIAAALALAIMSGNSVEAGYQSVYGAEFNPVEPAQQTVVEEQAPVVQDQAPVTENAVNIAEEQAPVVDEKPAIEPEHTLIKVKGIGLSAENDLNAAVELAKKNSVERVIAQVAKKGNYSEEITKKLADNYAKYIISFNTSDSVVAENGTTATLWAYVNYNGIENDAKEALAASTPEQPAAGTVNNVPEAPTAANYSSSEESATLDKSFRIMLRGNNAENQQIAAKITDILASDLQKLGFTDGGNPDITTYINAYSALSYEDYCRLFKQYEDENKDASLFAFIGEVGSETMMNDADEIVQQVNVKIKIYDIMYNRLLGEFSESYTDVDESVAANMAAEDTSRVLKEQIQAYWSANGSSIENVLKRKNAGVDSKVFY